ncbi:GTPase [Zemynaea arenosa]|uniref:GTPase n=1 Tax=Zemynaea arenosa TaxID=2561931 RepID=UPI0027D9A193|nr:GTPase [Massilia arenosa]
MAGLLTPGQSTAIILEGLPSGTPLLDDAPGLSLARIASGCLCCAGQLVLRVTLNRMLGRRPDARPQRLFIGLADEAHADQLRSWLSLTPYDQLLELGPTQRA